MLLNTKNMCTTRVMKKLENLHDGPFKVPKKVGASAYTLDIPESWKKASIHPTFNEKLVTPYHAPSFPSQQKLLATANNQPTVSTIDCRSQLKK